MAPKAAVNAPVRANRPEAKGAAAKIGASRTTRYPPALTIPACMNAETGVGVSIVSGSQLWKGNWADLRMAQPAKRTAEVATPPLLPRAT